MRTKLARCGVGASVGLLTAAVALGVGEVVAAFVRPAAAPVIVVGNRFILLTPEPVKRWAIRNVGTNDKTLLLSGIYIGIAVFAVVVGLLALRRLVYGLIGIAVFGVVGAYAALSTNAHRGSDVVPTIFGTLAALAVLVGLVRAAGTDAELAARPRPQRGRRDDDPAEASPAPVLANRRGFLQGSAWLAQIGLFVLLGLLATPARLTTQIVPAIVIGLVLLLVARPLSVMVSLTPFRVPWRDQAFLSWAGLRGAVPVVLATVPRTAGTPSVEWLFDLVFVLVVIFTLVQGPALPWMARRLGVTDAERALDLEVESTPLEELGADVLQMTVGGTSRLHGVEVFELRLPPGANVTLVVRGGKGFVPSPQTTLRHGDQLMIVATAETRLAAESRVREVSKRGRLAGWDTKS